MTLFLLLAGCAQPLHLQYDFGRSTADLARIQGDLSRPSVQDDAYIIEGSEALMLRENQRKAMAQKLNGTPTVTKTVQP
jgi:hypothetical protein